MIEDQSDHLARLVANLLDVARIDSGALVLHREAASVSDVIAAARRSVGTALAHHQLVVTVPSDLPLVDVDLVLVAQVVANLLTNAAHHSPEGSRIDVEATETSGAVTLSVSDNGPGVAEEDRERIFAMLDRRAGSGRAGLGLTIATAFVRAHGTRLEVGAGPTGGARFFFALPVAVIDEVGR
jgi:two-component system sensor histidine kinase KdpD